MFEGIRVGERFAIPDLATVHDVAHGELDDLAALGARDVRDLHDARGHMARTRVLANLLLDALDERGVELDDRLRAAIRDVIRSNATPRHVPAKIIAVSDIPRTKSGKIVELAVREIIHGRPVKNVEALANPEALEHFRNRSEIAEP